MKVIYGIIKGTSIGVINGDAGSLDYGPHFRCALGKGEQKPKGRFLTSVQEVSSAESAVPLCNLDCERGALISPKPKAEAFQRVHEVGCLLH